jgi:hypothetical protein
MLQPYDPSLYGDPFLTYHDLLQQPHDAFHLHNLHLPAPSAWTLAYTTHSQI